MKSSEYWENLKNEERGMAKERYELYFYLTVRELFNQASLVDLV